MSRTQSDALPATSPGLQADLRRLSSSAGRAATGQSLAEGWRLVERALAAHRHVGGAPEGSAVELCAVVVGPRAAEAPKRDEARVLAALLQAGVPVSQVDADALRQVTQGRTFGDLVGVVRLPRRALSTVLRGGAAADGAAPAPVLVCVDVLDPGNIGALTRTAHALGATAAIWLGGTDPTHPKALRSAMGASFRLPWVHIPLERGAGVPREVALATQGRGLAARLADAGWHNVATVARGGERLAGALPAGSAVWMGGEAHGLPDAVSHACDRRVCIAMRDAVDSLSVNAAAAVVLSRVSERLGQG